MRYAAMWRVWVRRSGSIVPSKSGQFLVMAPSTTTPILCIFAFVLALCFSRSSSARVVGVSSRIYLAFRSVVHCVVHVAT
jgi:hypothetical protein